MLAADVVAVVPFTALAKSLYAIWNFVGAPAVLVVFTVAVGVAGLCSPECHTACNRLYSPSLEVVFMVTQVGLMKPGVNPLLQGIHVCMQVCFKDVAVLHTGAEYLQSGKPLYIVILAGLSLVPAAVKLENVDCSNASKATCKLVPHRHEQLAVSVPRDVEHDKQVGPGVLLRVNQVVELPGPYFRPWQKTGQRSVEFSRLAMHPLAHFILIFDGIEINAEERVSHTKVKHMVPPLVRIISKGPKRGSDVLLVDVAHDWRSPHRLGKKR